LFSLIRGCDFDCAFFFAELGVKGLVCEDEYSFVNVRGFEKAGPVALSYYAKVNRRFNSFRECLSFMEAMMSWIV
jgi:hypothetical protein